MINLSYYKTLYFYNSVEEATVTSDIELAVQIHTSVEAQTAILYYTQGDGIFSVPLESNTDGYKALIKGSNLRSGTLSLFAAFDTEVTNTVQVRLTKLETSSLLIDDDVTFIVERDKRLILIPTTQAILAVHNDTNSEIITFKIARYADGIDLSTKQPLVNYRIPEGKVYRDSLTIEDIKESYIYCTWIITGFATQTVGEVQFALEFRGDNYRWQTQIASLSVVPSIQGEQGSEDLPNEIIDTDHRLLSNRDAKGQHPISAVEGLEEELDRIPAPTETLTNSELEGLLK